MFQGLARVLVSVPFIADSVEALRNPQRHVAMVRSSLDNELSRVDLPDLDDAKLKTIVQIHSAATLVAGAAMGLGKCPRTNALLLAALTVPRLVTSQPITAPAITRSARRADFVKTLGQLGSALAIAAIRPRVADQKDVTPSR